MKKCWKAALRKTFGLRAGVTSHKLGIWMHSNLTHWVWFFHPSSETSFLVFCVSKSIDRFRGIISFQPCILEEIMHVVLCGFF